MLSGPVDTLVCTLTEAQLVCVFTLASCFVFTALLADGYRLCSGLSGSLRYCLDGEGLGTGQEPSGDTG